MKTSSAKAKLDPGNQEAIAPKMSASGATSPPTRALSPQMISATIAINTFMITTYFIELLPGGYPAGLLCLCERTESDGQA